MERLTFAQLGHGVMPPAWMAGDSAAVTSVSDIARL